MNIKSTFQNLGQQEDLNFLLTNRIPRRLVTRFMGWFSKLEQPAIRDLSIATWKLFTELNLDEALKSDFTSMHDLFVRELKPGARPIDPDPRIMVSPCDGIVYGHGQVQGVDRFKPKAWATL